MNTYFKSLFSIAIASLLIVLTGCNSEGAFSSQPQPPIDATVIEITVTPSPISVLVGRTQQMVAVAKYDDGTESDVSDSVTWEIVGDPTVAIISASGLVTGNTKGDTELIAKKDGITSDTANVTVCDLAGTCIDIFDTGTGKLFTNSPSVAYLDSIGGSATNGIYTESGTYGPSGSFYLFNWTNANVLCTTYNTLSLGGRTNWRLATRDELKVELYDASGNMFTARGWPTLIHHWSATPDGSNYYSVYLYDGYVHSLIPSGTSYASCVSNP
ncbi:Ig-like domain-containing protein [Vibrio sp. TRT 29B02]|uniref:Ig-like domain-containing protein n=1 Tax=Vibrio sp. TRT 29B02 TaxID=3418508 RepID=UPI003CEA649A